MSRCTLPNDCSYYYIFLFVSTLLITASTACSDGTCQVHSLYVHLSVFLVRMHRSYVLQV